MIEFTADIGEAMSMLTRITGALNPEGSFGRIIPRLLDHKMHLQQEEKFASQGGGEWAQLSDWRQRDRGNNGPILDNTGAFRSRVSEYVGMWSAHPDSFTYIYPGMFMPDAGMYFGITAGQKVNPLAVYTKRTGNQGTRAAPIPMSRVPRPILFGVERMTTDLDSVMRQFLADAGFIGAGITGYAGD